MSSSKLSRARATRLAPLALVAGLGACAVAPTGPSMMVLPGTGKSFEQFQVDDGACRQFASGQVGGTDANQAAADSTVRSAAVGTVVGAVAGAAIGGSQGAGIGAGTGLLFGTAAGAGAGAGSAYGTQRRYDHGYVQCMYAKGHKVPVSGLYTGDARPVLRSAPPAPAAAGTPPPPPPGAPAPSNPAGSAAPAGTPGTSRVIPPPPPGNPPPPPPGVSG